MTVAIYWGVWESFFQQDEWMGLGQYFVLSQQPLPERLITLYGLVLKNGLGHFLVITPFLNQIRYALLGLDFVGYSILSLILHAVAVFLVFIVGTKLSRGRFYSFLGATFFAVGANSSQAVIWVGTSLPTQLALIFSLLAIFFWLDWLNSGTKSSLILTIFCVILAVGLKETALYLFVGLPAIALLVGKKKQTKKLMLVFAGTGMGYLFLRTLVLIAALGTKEAIAKIFSLVVSAGKSILGLLTSGVAQALVPQELVSGSVTFLDAIFHLNKFPTGSPEAAIFLENVVARVFLTVLGLAILAAAFLFIHYQTKEKSLLWASWLLFLTSFFPLAFIPNQELSATFFPGRGFYLPLAMFCLFLPLALERLKENKLILVIVLVLGATSLVFLRLRVAQQVEQAHLRKGILNTIVTQYPDLPKKAVFYFESDTAYYGLSRDVKTLPFQSGFGQNLLVWYYPGEKFPPEFFQDGFLWEITSQGYKEVGEVGFGYFRDLGLLEETTEQYALKPENIIGFSWKGARSQLVDISPTVREKLDFQK